MFLVILWQQYKAGEMDAASLDHGLLSSMSAVSTTSQQQALLQTYPLAIPQGQAEALPSIRVGSEAKAETPPRTIYGGKGDKKHLGGFTDIDTMGISPTAWKWMVQKLGVKSLLDVGCGRGISTTWFLMHGVDILCVEGSHDAKERTMLPDPDTQMIEHDFSRGPWWPAKTYDAIWCVEFLEHVGRNFHHNYLPTFRKAAVIFVTHSIWGGWHHVEVHREDWWKMKMEMYGFRYSPELTQAIRTQAWNETHANPPRYAPNGKKLGAPHIHSPNMQAFINPAVSALPQHAHMYYQEPGCYSSRQDGVLYTRDCGDDTGESVLPDDFKPLVITPQQDEQWHQWVKERVKPYDGPDAQKQ